jgi:hypothetical protein
MREKFTAEQWQTLKELPFIAFVFVASCDGKVDQKEIGEFANRVSSAAGYKDELHRELMMDVASTFEESFNHAIQRYTSGSAADDLIQIRGVLDDKLTTDETQRFVASVIVDAIAIARCSGGGLFGGNKVSDKEAEAIAALAMALGLDPASVQRYYG